MRIPAGLQRLFDPSPAATAMAAGSFALMVFGTVGTIVTGRWYFRALIVVGALVWPLPDHPWQGPVVLRLGYAHGVHVSDLLSVVALIVAVLPWQRSRARTRR